MRFRRQECLAQKGQSCLWFAHALTDWLVAKTGLPEGRTSFVPVPAYESLLAAACLPVTGVASLIETNRVCIGLAGFPA